jgi:hypothetical protein
LDWVKFDLSMRRRAQHLNCVTRYEEELVAGVMLEEHPSRRCHQEPNIRNLHLAASLARVHLQQKEQLPDHLQKACLQRAANPSSRTVRLSYDDHRIGHEQELAFPEIEEPRPR